MTGSLSRRLTPRNIRFGAAMVAMLLAGGSAQAVVSATGNYPAPADAAFLEGVARLSINRNDGNFGCSGSLLAGGTAVLTAAHCVTGNTGTATTSGITLSWQSGSVTAASSSYVVSPGWNGSLSTGNDIAVVLLSAPVLSVQGYQLAQGSTQGAPMLLAGYGLSGNGTSGASAGTFGTLRYGFNEYDAPQAFYNAVSFASDRVAFFDFDNGLSSGNVFGSGGFLQFESMVASGDSGGPSFVRSSANAPWLIAGVHSFGACILLNCTVDSRFGTLGGDVVASRHAAWIANVTTPVPEPDAWALLLAGLGLLGWRASGKIPAPTRRRWIPCPAIAPRSVLPRNVR